MKDFDNGFERTTVIDGQQVKFVVNRNALAALGVEERTFKIGDEKFVRVVAVAPETFVPYYAYTTGETTLATTEEQALNLYDGTILACLEPGQEEKWKKVRAVDAPHPLTLLDMDALITWLIAEMSGRPTELPPGSARGSGGSAAKTSSSPASGSPVETA